MNDAAGSVTVEAVGARRVITWPGVVLVTFGSSDAPDTRVVTTELGTRQGRIEPRGLGRLLARAVAETPEDEDPAPLAVVLTSPEHARIFCLGEVSYSLHDGHNVSSVRESSLTTFSEIVLPSDCRAVVLGSSESSTVMVVPAADATPDEPAMSSMPAMSSAPAMPSVPAMPAMAPTPAAPASPPPTAMSADEPAPPSASPGDASLTMAVPSGSRTDSFGSGPPPYKPSTFDTPSGPPPAATPPPFEATVFAPPSSRPAPPPPPPAASPPAAAPPPPPAPVTLAPPPPPPAAPASLLADIDSDDPVFSGSALAAAVDAARAAPPEPTSLFSPSAPPPPPTRASSLTSISGIATGTSSGPSGGSAMAGMGTTGASTGAKSWGRLRFDDGRELDVTSTLILGRFPQIEEAAIARGAIPITVDNSAVSRSHCSLRPEGDRVVLVDHEPKNGTYHRSAIGEWRMLRPGEQLMLEAGDEVMLGPPDYPDVRCPSFSYTPM